MRPREVPPLVIKVQRERGRAETTRAVTSERDGSADAPRRAGAGAVEREIPRVVNTREVDNAEATTDELGAVIARVSEEGEERE